MNRPWRACLKTALFAALISGGAFACGKRSAQFDPEAILTRSCRAPTDQRRSFLARVPEFPVKLQVDETFTSAQRASIEDVVGRWNSLGRTLIGTDFYAIEDTRFSDSIRAISPSDCAKTYGSSDTIALYRERSSERWESLGFGPNVPGATLRCYSGEEVTRQSVMLYTPVIHDAQFSSVITHELGHSLGLDHSCTSAAASEKYRSCSGISDNHPYRVAVMYPTLRMRSSDKDQGEIKENLGANDVLRTECLYSSQN